MVQLYVGVTDRAWFESLSRSSPHDEVNFWQPSGSREFRRLQSGELFLFKLHAPDNFIVGGGIFSNASNVPLSIAWDAFGTKNGVATILEMRTRIARYRDDPAILDERQDPLIGCRIITQPFFWTRDRWLQVPASWAPNIVSGKGYDTESGDGLSLWNEVQARLSAESADASQLGMTVSARYGAPRLIAPRLGQGAFRLWVTDSYDRRCAVTGEKTLPILDAAHIKSFAAGGEHAPANGVLLRTDIHRLFDLGYVTVSDDRRFVVSSRLKADFDNGREYYALQGTPLRAPRRGSELPSPAALTWHRENRYLG
jgi:putative restriction endonuclease